jgi:putative ABC transport system permease protein
MMLNDLRYASRMLLKSRAFTFGALAALAIGIGATTAMFSAVNAVLLRPLPFPDAERLFTVRETRAQSGFERTVVSEGEYLQWGRNNPHFEDAAIVEMPGLSVRIGDSPERVPALRVPADFFPLFGVTAAAGRIFARDAEQPGRGDVILLSYNIWQSRLGGSAEAVGRTVVVEGRPFTVIGILPRNFTFGGRVDAIVPMTLGPAQAAQFSAHSFDMYARLKPGVVPAQAAADLTRLVLSTQGNPPHATGAALLPLHEEVVGDSRTSMLVLFGAVALVLLIACANIANLLLARATSRQREIAVRSALGASRSRVMRQLVTESLLLSAVGGALGLVIALWLTDLLARSAADSLPRALEISMDARAFAFAFAVSLLSGLLFGVTPAWQASRVDVHSALKQEMRGGTGTGRTRVLSFFAATEIALALVLLVGAGLLLATFENLRHVDPGFDPAHVLTAPAYLPEWKYATPEQQRAFFQRATFDLTNVPGVTAAAAVNALPLSGNNSSGTITLDGFPPPPPSQFEKADRRAITPAYFRAMGIQVLGGRAFTDRDNERSPGVVIVSRSLAEHYWPGHSPIGKRLKLGRYGSDAPWLTIVGVAADVRHSTLAAASRQVVYYPHAQLPSGGMELVVRTAADNPGVVSAVRSTISRIDPDLPVDSIPRMTDLVRSSLLDHELEFALLGSFAVVAVVLAAAGIYGVMTYTMAQRAQEFGIRLALGASSRDIVRLVTIEGIRLTATGTLVGIGAAWVGARMLGELLYGVAPADPTVFACAATLLAVTALSACVVPTLKALRVDPLTSLRSQ